MQALFYALREIANMNRKYDHYIFMSGQDYLIKPISQIVTFLNKNKEKNYLEYSLVTDKEIMGRYLEYRTGIRYVDAILRRILPKRNIFYEKKVYYGSSWWILNEDAVKYMTAEYYSRYYKKLYMTVCIDEIIYQTILANSKFKDSIINDNKRYIDWSDHKKGLNDGNPNILRKNDYEKIINSGKFIARKLDCDIDEEIMNMLDKYRGEI